MKLARPWRDWNRWRFWRRLLVAELTIIGGVATFLGLYDVFEPGEISKLEISPVLVPLFALPIALLWAWPRQVEQDFSIPRTQIRIVEGDLLEQESHLVINMTTTFDTKTPDIIAAQSVQGQMLTTLYEGDVTALDRDLASALAGAQPHKTFEKPGKREAYPVGTVAVVRRDGRLLFCVAMSEMDAENAAQATIKGLWTSLNCIWSSVRARSNGAPTAIPVVGGGQSKLSNVLPAQDSIRFIALSFILASRQSRVCERLDIIVQKSQAKDMNFPELQAFLKAMREC